MMAWVAQWLSEFYGMAASAEGLLLGAALVGLCLATKGAVTDLWARGYAALPYPRQVSLAEGDLALDPSWRVALGPGVEPDEVAAETLREGLREHLGVDLDSAAKAAPNTIALAVAPATVAEDAAESIARQGYRLEIAPDRVAIVGNSPVGLFYGVHTLLQLLRRGPGGEWELPVCRIEDWPDGELRLLHYDTKHHQERLDAVKAFIARAASFKVNGIAWEIEDKFAYEKHPVIGAPGAFTKSEMQEITAYALRRHVEIIPIVQGPSHLAFVLKHEEFSHLREDARNNYMLCPSNEESYRLLFDMCDELIEATPGCRYFHVGTDEPYFLGDGIECGCRARRDEIGQGGMMAEFISRATAYLREKGREVMCWAELPMRPPDVPRLPRGIINAVFQDPDMGKAYREQGIRELIYCPTQGGESLFPGYFAGSDVDGHVASRIEDLYRTISHGEGRAFDPLGVIIAAWDDNGLHQETFWLGWVTGVAYGWNPGTPGPAEVAPLFMRLFHGQKAVSMMEVYRGMERLAKFWARAWDEAPSKRGPSYKRQWHRRFDRTLALPHVPDPDNLDNKPFFAVRYADLLAQAGAAKAELAGVVDLLMENLGRVRRNRYTLEVFLSIASLVRDHISLLKTLAGAERMLDRARQEVGAVQFERAASLLREAAKSVREHVAQRERTLANLTATWEKSRDPKGQSVGGRDFVHIQDNTKNHEAEWTPDLGYLVKASRELDLEGWAGRVEAAAEEFLRRNPRTERPWRPGPGGVDARD